MKMAHSFRSLLSIASCLLTCQASHLAEMNEHHGRDGRNARLHGAHMDCKMLLELQLLLRVLLCE
jgi:hypothetical protein